MSNVNRGAKAELGIEGIVDAEEWASGGHATIYRAFQPAHEREVAVKVIRELADTPTRRRFANELDSMEALSAEPGILDIYESGVTAAGHMYLVTPFLTEGSLQDRTVDKGPMPWAEALTITAKVARSVSAAHRAGVVHRDIKPANVLIDDFGEPVIADFGISRPVGDERAMVTSTISATPAFSAPEEFNSVSAEPAGDVYSLAATAYGLIAATPPHLDRGEKTSNLALMNRVAEQPIGDLRPAIPDEVHALFETAMHKDPSQRPTASELADRFDELAAKADLDFDPNATIIGKRPEPAVAPPTPAPDSDSASSKSTLVGALALLGLVLGGFALFSLLTREDDGDGGSDTDAENAVQVTRDLTAPSNITIEELGVNEESGAHLDVRVDWDHEPAAGETAPREFLVFRRRDDGIEPLPAVQASDASELAIERKLQLGEREYCITVVAVQSISQRSPRSEEKCVTTPARLDGSTAEDVVYADPGEPPVATDISRFVAKTHGITTIWHRHADPTTVKEFRVELLRDGDVVDTIAPGALTGDQGSAEFLIEAEDNYCVRVTPTNDSGDGPAAERCMDYRFVAGARPPAATLDPLVIGDDGIEATWTNDIDGTGVEVTGIDVDLYERPADELPERGRVVQAEETDGDGTSMTFDRPGPGDYCVDVLPYNSSGPSEAVAFECFTIDA